MQIDWVKEAVTCPACGTLNEQGLYRIEINHQPRRAKLVCADCLMLMCTPECTVQIVGVMRVSL